MLRFGLIVLAALLFGSEVGVGAVTSYHWDVSSGKVPWDSTLPEEDQLLLVTQGNVSTALTAESLRLQDNSESGGIILSKSFLASDLAGGFVAEVRMRPISSSRRFIPYAAVFGPADQGRRTQLFITPTQAGFAGPDPDRSYVGTPVNYGEASWHTYRIQKNAEQLVSFYLDGMLMAEMPLTSLATGPGIGDGVFRLVTPFGSAPPFDSISTLEISSITFMVNGIPEPSALGIVGVFVGMLGLRRR